jgi:terminase small subunit-like protein
MSGRPSSYTEELAEEIIGGLLEGKSLVKVCEPDHMPNRRTVMRWMEGSEDFATKCARAREMQADLMDDKISDLIDQCSPETAPADRVKLSALQWRASKLAPKKYGDRLDLTHSGSIARTSDDQLDARITELLGKAGIAQPAGGEGKTEEP